MASGTVTIADEASLSGEFKSNYAPLVGISVPTIDSAVITFQVKLDPDDSFRDLYDADGEVTLGDASTGARTYSLISQLAGVHSFKIRSGTSGSPVNQTTGAVEIFVSARTGTEG